jgi:predicted metal-dependent hydrolase
MYSNEVSIHVVEEVKIWMWHSIEERQHCIKKELAMKLVCNAKPKPNIKGKNKVSPMHEKHKHSCEAPCVVVW